MTGLSAGVLGAVAALAPLVIVGLGAFRVASVWGLPRTGRPALLSRHTAFGAIWLGPLIAGLMLVALALYFDRMIAGTFWQYVRWWTLWGALPAAVLGLGIGRTSRPGLIGRVKPEPPSSLRDRTRSNARYDVFITVFLAVAFLGLKVAGTYPWNLGYQQWDSGSPLVNVTFSYPDGWRERAVDYADGGHIALVKSAGSDVRGAISAAEDDHDLTLRDALTYAADNAIDSTEPLGSPRATDVPGAASASQLGFETSEPVLGIAPTRGRIVVAQSPAGGFVSVTIVVEEGYPHAAEVLEHVARSVRLSGV